MIRHRVTYTSFGVRYACEYQDLEEANRNFRDISGYDLIFDCKVETVDSPEPICPGPVRQTSPETRFNREDPVES